MGPKKEFTINETVALMNEDTASVLRSIADFINEWQLDREEIVEFLREVSDAKDAQSVVCRLRDDLKKQS